MCRIHIITKKERYNMMRETPHKTLQEVVLILEENTLPLYEQDIPALARELEAHHIAFRRMTLSDTESAEVLEQLEENGLCGRLYVSDSAGAICYLQRKDACIVLLEDACHRNTTVTGIRYVVEGLSGIDCEYLQRVYLRLRGEPWTILRTERCIIREMTPEDVPALYEIYADRQTVRYMEDLYDDPEEEIRYTKAYIENIYAFYGYGMWLIEDKADGRVIGRAGVEYKEGREGVELGFMIARRCWKQGFATEAVSAILDYTKEQLGILHVYAMVEEDNDKSLAFCSKMGFVRTGESSADSKRYLIMEKDL